MGEEEVKGGGYRTLGEQGEPLVPPVVEPERVEFDTPFAKLIKSVGMMKTNGVKPHKNGYYQANLTWDTLSTMMADPVFQRLNQSMVDDVDVDRFVGHMAGIVFIVGGDTDSLTGENFTSPL